MRSRSQVISGHLNHENRRSDHAPKTKAPREAFKIAALDSANIRNNATLILLDGLDPKKNKEINKLKKAKKLTLDPIYCKTFWRSMGSHGPSQACSAPTALKCGKS